MADIIHRFEIEHIINDALWNDPEIKAFLKKVGYRRDMAGNKLALFSDPDSFLEFRRVPGTQYSEFRGHWSSGDTILNSR